MLFTESLLNQLADKAKESERLRMNLDLRNSDKDNSQRMLNALEPGTELPVHRHRNSSESVVVLRGKIEQQIFDDKGNLFEKIILMPLSENIGMNVPAGVWHKTVALESGTVIFEAKDGNYQPLSEEDILKFNL